MPHYYPAVRYGGPIRSVQGLAAATAALGQDVHVYTTNVDGPGVSDVPTAEPVDVDGVKVWYFPAGAGRKVFRSPAMGRALDATVGSFDVVHIHYMWVWTTVRAAAAARYWEVPYVLAPRGMLVADLIQRRRTAAKKIWLALFDARNIARAAAIHATSDVEATDLKVLGLAARRIAVIPNGIDLHAERGVFGGSPAGVCATTESRKRYILFLGRISWKKGLDRLIGALPTIEAADLVIAGYEEQSYAAVVKRLAEEGGVTGRVRFVGPTEGVDKWALIRGAACLVLPSYHENFGMTVIEAMAVGCPVVVTAEVGLSVVVAETGSGLVAPGDHAGLAAAVNVVLNNPVRARAMGEAGRRVVAERFGWPAIAARMVELYAACAKG